MRQCQQIKSCSSSPFMSVFREEHMLWLSNKKTNLSSRYEYFTVSGRIHLIQEPPHPLRNAACGSYLASSLQASLLLWGENYSLFCFFPKAAAFQYILIKPCELHYSWPMCVGSAYLVRAVVADWGFLFLLWVLDGLWSLCGVSVLA